MLINDQKSKRLFLAISFLGGLLLQPASSQDASLAERYSQVWKQYAGATCPLPPDSIRHFVYVARDRELIHDHPFLEIPRFAGAQIMYCWKDLEPEKDVYDFSMIREDYAYLLSKGKKLFIQLQDASFDPERIEVPKYLLTAEYDGGASPEFNDDSVGVGWVAKRWNPTVRERFALLLNALGKEFDGKVEGINLQESAIEVRHKTDSSFTSARYAEALKINMLALKKAFPHAVTMQYANFMPGEWLPWNDKGYLRSIYAYGQEIGVGLGSPDLMIQNKGQLNHPMAMMHEHHYTVPLGIAVQDGNYAATTGADADYEQRNQAGTRDTLNLVPLLHAFAKDFLHVRYMFWVIQEPYFSRDVMPCFAGK
jgi:hypothetical protein